MTLLWPEMLWLGIALPALVLLYLWLLGRRKKTVLNYPALALVKQAAGKGPSWRRHLPPALVLAALAAVIVAGARPAAVLTLPTHEQTVIMVMDVSGSMRATDVLPDRISASQTAAKTFAADLPRDVRIGVVAYGGTAHLVQAPTLSRAEVIAAIDRFQLQRGTAIGSGLYVALATLFPDAGIDLGKITGQRDQPQPLPTAPGRGQPDSSEFVPVQPGSFRSAAILLLTDGQNTVGPDPIDAAQMAASRGVKVFTVGFGTKEGEVIGFEGWNMRVRLDEDTLKKIANLTQGEYFHAGSGADLKKVYQALQSRLVFEKKETEITVVFALVAGVLMLVAAGLSVWWFGRVT